MANEPEVIRQQMEETRSDLQTKLETLEQQVKDTVQEATEAVSDTVATVKETVKETVETVKETVEETVESVKETFNLTRQVQAHPWPAFACATLVGFVGSRLLLRWRAQGETPAAAPTLLPRPVCTPVQLPPPKVCPARLRPAKAVGGVGWPTITGRRWTSSKGWRWPLRAVSSAKW